MSAPTATTKSNSAIDALVINGSPRLNGNSSILLDEFLRSIPKETEIKTYNAFELNCKPCVDCGYCKTNIGCKFKDLNDFYRDFENCDLIFFSTPVYNYSVPAPLKAILDRMQRYYNEHFAQNKNPPINKNRRAVILSTCGSTDNFGFEVIEYQLKRIFTVTNIELLGTVFVDNLDNKEITKADKEQCIELVNKISSKNGER